MCGGESMEFDSDIMLPSLDKKLAPIWEKIQTKVRLGLDDARTLYASPDLLGVGWMAKQAKEARYGKKAFYVLNQKIEPTNICVLSCKFCDFAAKKGRPNAYAMTIPEIVGKCSGDIREIHISGGMHPDWKFEDYLGIVRALRDHYPHVGIKAFTAVEIEWYARTSKQSVREVLLKLKEAGLCALPGGGAEVFSERVRKALFPFKIGAKGWLDVHRTAHELGIPSNATLLYGHIETLEERWRHLELLRRLQDEGSGFLSFIPLAFQPGKTGLAVESPTVLDDLRMLAISRLYLDNFPHIKAYWVTLGEETASLGLHFGADDIDGTIGEERIMHAAGAQSPSGLVRERLQQLIREADGVPVERDALYNVIDGETGRRGDGGTDRIAVSPSHPVTQSPSQIAITVAYIPYLNMVPFHQGFGPTPLQKDGVQIRFLSLSPRALGREAETGRLDAGAMSLVDYFCLSDRFESIGAFGIGVKKAAGSVLLFSRSPIGDLQGICAVTDETSTSVRLLQILLEKRYGLNSVSYGRIASPLLYDGSAEALLLIGDEALQARRTGIKGLPIVTDLGEEWYRWQGSPFAFARWVVRKDLSPKAKETLCQCLEDSLNAFFSTKHLLANAQAPLRSMESAEIEGYWNSFAFVLTPEHDRSMERFKELFATPSPAL